MVSIDAIKNFPANTVTPLLKYVLGKLIYHFLKINSVVIYEKMIHTAPYNRKNHFVFQCSNIIPCRPSHWVFEYCWFWVLSYIHSIFLPHITHIFLKYWHKLCGVERKTKADRTEEGRCILFLSFGFSTDTKISNSVASQPTPTSFQLYQPWWTIMNISKTCKYINVYYISHTHDYKHVHTVPLCTRLI